MCYPIIVAALLGITAGQAGVKNLRRAPSLLPPFPPPNFQGRPCCSLSSVSPDLLSFTAAPLPVPPVPSPTPPVHVGLLFGFKLRLAC